MSGHFFCGGDPMVSEDRCGMFPSGAYITQVLDGTGHVITVLVPACQQHQPAVMMWLVDQAVGEGFWTTSKSLRDPRFMADLREALGEDVFVHSSSAA